MGTFIDTSAIQAGNQISASPVKTALDALDTQAAKEAAGSGASVTNIGDLSVPSAVFTTLTFNRERYDTNNYHSTSVNSSRLTLPENGVYLVGVNLVYNTLAAGWVEIHVLLNGTTRILQYRDYRPGTTGDIFSCHMSRPWIFSTGDYVEVQIYQDTTDSMTIFAELESTPEFWVELVRRV